MTPRAAPRETAAQIELHRLRNAHIAVGILNLGARIVSLEVPDREGRHGDVVLGYESGEDYRDDTAYLGATVGRYANRIAGGRLTIGGREARLTTNDDGNTLHGGTCGFDRRFWSVQNEQAVACAPDLPALTLDYVSAAGEEGFPGRLEVSVRYTLIEDALRIDYAARTDATTVVNLTHHSYFNLSARHEQPILGHLLTVDADRFTPIDARLIPTGELRAVEETPFDFREERALGARIDAQDAQLRFARGYDHNFVLRAPPPAATETHPAGMRRAARVHEPGSGRVLELWTTEPGLQLYSGNQLDGSRRGKRGVPLGYRCGVCLETQHFPDSPHHPRFPSTQLAPGMPFASTTIYRFSTAPT